MFAQADLQQNNYLKFKEFFNLAKSIAKELDLEVPTSEQTQELFWKLDQDQDDKLTYEEILPYLQEIFQMRALQEAQESQEDFEFESYEKLLENWEITSNLMHKIFQKYDPSQNGMVKIEEIEELISVILDVLKIPEEDH